MAEGLVQPAARARSLAGPLVPYFNLANHRLLKEVYKCYLISLEKVLLSYLRGGESKTQRLLSNCQEQAVNPSSVPPSPSPGLLGNVAFITAAPQGDSWVYELRGMP